MTDKTLIQLRAVTFESSPWVTTMSELRRPTGGIRTPEELRDAFALPRIPQIVAIVSGFPDGSKVYMGHAAGNKYGRGGAFQIIGDAVAEITEVYALTDVLAYFSSL